MNFRRYTVFSVLVLLSGAAYAAEVSIAPDRILEINGARTFILGLYENPADDAVLDEVARAGFNLIRADGDLATLDRLQQHGLYGWIPVGGTMELGPDSGTREKDLADVAARCRTHPALVAWEGPDESLWMCWVNIFRRGGSVGEMTRLFRDNADALAAGLTAGYRKLKEADPGHPVWLNHAAGNSQEYLAEFGLAADIVGADIYPLMPYPTKPVDVSRIGLGWVGMCTEKMQGSAPGKPVWMVLQGMGWASLGNDLFTLKPMPGQWPTYEESRFMAWDTVVRGARGILYWGTHAEAKDSECWKGITRVVRELADQQTLLAAPDATVTPSVESMIFGLLPFTPGGGGLGVKVLGKVVDGKTWWLVVNEYFFPVTYTLRGLEEADGTKYADMTSSTEAVVRNGALTASLESFGVHVLRPASS